MLQEHGVPDWIDQATDTTSMAQFQQQVSRGIIVSYRSSWITLAKGHTAQVPYTLLESEPGVGMQELKLASLSAHAQLCLRNWCRRRCGLILLRHLRGRMSHARYQDCVFCQDPVRNAAVHVMGICLHWAVRRQE